MPLNILSRPKTVDDKIRMDLLYHAAQKGSETIERVVSVLGDQDAINVYCSAVMHLYREVIFRRIAKSRNTVVGSIAIICRENNISLNEIARAIKDLPDEL